MNIKLAPQGLCVNCVHVPYCKHRKEHSRPILFCEEFDCYESHPKEDIKLKKPDGPKQKVIIPYVGLCRNCDNRKICKKPKSDSGIWFCEEYK